MASDRDDDFEPRLGRIRARGGKGGIYLHRALRAAGRAGPGLGRARASAFTGARIGRGAGWGARAIGQRGFAGRRRVVIKTRIVKLAGRGIGGARAHLNYIQRDGVTREGDPGRLYDASSDEADGRAFLERAEGDRHQFRFIVSPEDGAALDDLKPFVRDLMAGMERDLGTRLDWVAVDHFNTDNPHTHIVLRGRCPGDDRTKDLVIARDYIAHGMRERASELLTLELGPVPEHEIRRGQAREVEQERFTRLDRDLLRDAEGGMVDLRREPRGEYARFRHGLKIGRLRRLERMGIAEEVGTKRWRLAPELEPTLRAMGERGDIIRTLHREMRAAGLARAPADCAIFDPTVPHARVAGRVVARGFSDELHDRHHLVVDGLDGRTHYAEVGELTDPGDFEPGAIVALEAWHAGPRRADLTIHDIAERTGGLYSEALHREIDPGASDDYVRSHVRRLEAIRRAGLVERHADGSWEIPDDFLERAQSFEEQGRRRQPARAVLLASFSLERMVAAEGATWLDRQLVAGRPEPVRGAGFGREFEDALDRRRRWLLAQGLAEEFGDRTIFRRHLLRELRSRELRSAAEALSKDLGKPFASPEEGERVEGVYRRPVRLASGKFALIERNRDFTLVPWRDVLERSRDKQVSGILRGQAISWTIGRTPRGRGMS